MHWGRSGVLEDARWNRSELIGGGRSEAGVRGRAMSSSNVHASIVHPLQRLGEDRAPSRSLLSSLHPQSEPTLLGRQTAHGGSRMGSFQETVPLSSRAACPFISIQPGFPSCHHGWLEVTSPGKVCNSQGLLDFMVEHLTNPERHSRVSVSDGWDERRREEGESPSVPLRKSFRVFLLVVWLEVNPSMNQRTTAMRNG